MKDILTLDQFKDKHYGKKGTTKREKLEAGYQAFKMKILGANKLFKNPPR